MPHEMRKCECCVFWEEIEDEKNGLCKRKTPQVEGFVRLWKEYNKIGREYFDVAVSQYRIFPVTDDSDWCGDIHVKGVGGWEALV